jgi:CheY-like chemotaxis protein/two-component sensor histidine kinase
MENKELSAQFFLSNLSHEIRTPLNGIVGYTQLLQQTKLDNTQKMYLNSANQCCIQLVELVNDILDFSKLAMDKVTLNNECFSMNEVFQDVESALNCRIKEKKQTCAFVLDKNLPNYIISDKQKITQIFINLVSNANKFTSVGGRILVCVNIKGNNVLECTVEDDGIGISREDQKHLFNPFFQVQETLTKNGSGLGLAICKKLVNLLEGDISVDSDKGEGTVFTFTMKYEPYEEFKKYLDKCTHILKGKYVLIVDNDVDHRLETSEIFFQYGMFPIICYSERESLRILQRYNFSVILLSDDELGKKIKEINCEIPIISTNSSPGYNFEGCVQKPVNQYKLLDVVMRIINKHDIKQFQLNPIAISPLETKLDVRFLIAEDISYNTDILLKMLNNMNYNNIDTVTDGEEAILKLKDNEYDILLLDLKMPKIDGFGVAEWIKINSKNIKIIVLTASVLETDRERCKGLDIKYFLLKPFNMSHLKIIINKIVNGSM